MLHKEQRAQRLAAKDGRSSYKDTEVQYSVQVVLRNLDWKMDALEEAINTSNMKTKLARLDMQRKCYNSCYVEFQSKIKKLPVCNIVELPPTTLVKYQC